MYCDTQDISQPAFDKLNAEFKRPKNDNNNNGYDGKEPVTRRCCRQEMLTDP